MINNEADKVLKKLFTSVKNRYQNNFKSIKGSDYVQLGSFIVLYML